MSDDERLALDLAHRQCERVQHCCDPSPQARGGSKCPEVGPPPAGAGVGRPAGPAPAPAAQTAAATKTNWAMYAGLAVAAGVVFWLLFKRK